MIYINLIPSNVWYLNLRKMLTKTSWTNLSNEVREKSNWTCYCCGISLNQLKNKKYFHTHEYWLFNRETKQIKLAALVCVCSKCHAAIHIGYSSLFKKQDDCIKQIMKINKWSYTDVRNYVEASFEEHALNSTVEWNFDLDSFKQWLDDDEFNQVITFIENSKKHPF